MHLLGYISTVRQADLLLRELENGKAVEDGMFADGKRKTDKKLMFTAPYPFRMQLLPLQMEKGVPSNYRLNFANNREYDLKGVRVWILRH